MIEQDGNATFVQFAVFQSELEKLDDFFDNSYYYLIKKYLIYLGQYPYQATGSRIFHSIVLLVLIITLIIPQLYQLSHTVVEKNIDQLIMCLPPLFTNAACFVKLFNLHINKKKFRKIFDLIEEEFHTLKSENKIRILEGFTKEGYQFGYMYRNYIMGVMITYLCVPLVPVILDVVLPRNESRPRIQAYEVDYIVDKDQYFYPIYIHAVVSSVCSVLILFTVDWMYIQITYHACGLFALCGYQVGVAIDELKENMGECKEMKEQRLYNNLRECAIAHKRAIEFVECLASSSSGSYFLQVGINMLIISVTGVQTVIKLHETEEAARLAVFVVAQNIHLFFNSLPGQKIINCSSEFINVIYCSDWYKIPISTQKIIYMMQIRCRKPCKLTAGGLCDMNMETFGTMVRTSMSYFTMFLSLRE